MTGDPTCVVTPASTPIITIAKTSPSTTVAPNATLAYTLTLTNSVAGTTQASGYTFNEVVPANTTFTSVAGATSSCAAGSVAGTLCTITTSSQVVAGTARSITFTVTVNATLPAGTTKIVNQAYYITAPPGCTGPSCTPPPCTGTVCTPPPSCMTGDPTCVVTPASTPIITIAKTGPAATVAPSATLAYTLTLTNTVAGSTQARDRKSVV